VTREVDTLLAEEIERRVASLSAQTPTPEARNALHSVRGSAALAGHGELALLLAHLGARLRAGDLEATSTARSVLETAAQRLRAGSPPLAAAWPRPPPGLGPPLSQDSHDPHYRGAIRARLVELEAVTAADDLNVVMRDAYRIVHSIKGAAATTGDDLLAWYCHGLEAMLKNVPENQQSQAVAKLEEHRGALALIFEDPEQALRALRGHGTEPPVSATTSTSAAPQPEGALHIGSQTIDRWLERLEQLYVLEETLDNLAETARGSADVLRAERGSLWEALRQIGPPRPWGAPASAILRIERVARTLAAIADGAEQSRGVLRESADAIGRRYGELREELSHLRRTTAREFLTRTAQAAERTVAREARLVRVDVFASEAPLDRSVADRLFDPLLQLVRNAIAHGIEPPRERAERGKPPIGTITLSAEPTANWMRITVQDDGRGVDFHALRAIAVERSLLSESEAQEASEEALLGLLGEPGLSLAKGASLLAGRGIGLDVARGTIQSLGGSLRFSSHAGSGVTVTIEVPSDRAMVDIVWLESGRLELALPLRFVDGVSNVDSSEHVRSLADCLGVEAVRAAKLSVALTLTQGELRKLGVDRVGQTETARLFPLPRAITRAGPYSGSVLRRDGRLGLVLDAQALAARLQPEL
jgi:chemotaxis protein histidine kinase CheA